MADISLPGGVRTFSALPAGIYNIRSTSDKLGVVNPPNDGDVLYMNKASDSAADQKVSSVSASTFFSMAF